MMALRRPAPRACSATACWPWPSWPPARGHRLVEFGLGALVGRASGRSGPAVLDPAVAPRRADRRRCAGWAATSRSPSSSGGPSPRRWPRARAARRRHDLRDLLRGHLRLPARASTPTTSARRLSSSSAWRPWCSTAWATRHAAVAQRGDRQAASRAPSTSWSRTPATSSCWSTPRWSTSSCSCSSRGPQRAAAEGLPVSSKPRVRRTVTDIAKKRSVARARRGGRRRRRRLRRPRGGVVSGRRLVLPRRRRHPGLGRRARGAAARRRPGRAHRWPGRGQDDPDPGHRRRASACAGRSPRRPSSSPASTPRWSAARPSSTSTPTGSGGFARARRPRPRRLARGQRHGGRVGSRRRRGPQRGPPRGACSTSTPATEVRTATVTGVGGRWAAERRGRRPRLAGVSAVLMLAIDTSTSAIGVACTTVRRVLAASTVDARGHSEQLAPARRGRWPRPGRTRPTSRTSRRHRPRAVHRAARGHGDGA